MTNLNKSLKEALQKIPQIFLRQLVEEKLQEQGVKNEELLAALTDHILAGGGETFSWDDGDNDRAENINLNLEFSEQDTKDLKDKHRIFLKDNLPRIIIDSVKDSAKLIVKSLEEEWPERKVDDVNKVRHFRDRLELRWAKGLDPLRMMLIASHEMGEEFIEKLSRSKAKTGLVKREALAALHVRTCKTVLEVITLLENGLPDGAYARWRTLHEISVVAFVIDQFGDEIAERYLMHDVVSERESLVNEFRYSGKKYDPKRVRGEHKEIEEDFQAALRKFGKPFSSPYGWAASSLDLKRPTFQDLERAVDWNVLSPDYKWSSYTIHGGVAGTVRTLGVTGDSQVIHAGATNAGLAMPAILTAYSLMHMNSLVCGRVGNLEVQIKMTSLLMLRDKVTKRCQQVAKELEADELALQEAYEATS